MNLIPESLVLNKESIKKIHSTSINILENIGIKLLHDKLFEYIQDFEGVKVDKQNSVVKFSPEIVNNSIKKASRNIKVYGRDKNNGINFNPGKVFTTSSWGMPFKIDTMKDKKVLASSEDLKESAVINDYLENIDMVGAMFRPADIPEYYRDVYEYGETIKRTTKPVAVWITDGNSFEYIIEIYKLFLDDKERLEEYPPIFYHFENISPLTFQHDGVDILYKCAKLGLPIHSVPIPQPMATGPVTIAGSLALGNAEVLACLVLTQLIKPGLPFMYGLECLVPDPFTMVATFGGAPEHTLFILGQFQLARYYGFTVFLNQLTCSNLIDFQMGVELGINTLFCLSGNFFGQLGIVGPDQGASLIKLILEDETISYLKRIKEGFKVDDNTLAYDVIKNVGIGGNFLLEEHTLKYVKSEYWRPKIFNRDSYTVWDKKGKMPLINKAKELKNHILKTHKVDYVKADIEKEIDKIIVRAKDNLKK